MLVRLVLQAVVFAVFSACRREPATQSDELKGQILAIQPSPAQVIDDLRRALPSR